MTSSRVARASFWAIAGGSSQYFITFLLLIYFANVLEPRDFGLMATVSIGLDLGMQIARWGQVELLQQSRYKTDEARNQSLRMSLAIAMLFAVAFVIAAQPLGRFYASQELATMLYLCAPVFIFSALSSTAEGILRSDFRFQLLAYRGTVTALLGGGVAIIMIIWGFGAVALAAQRFVQSFVALVWMWSGVSWRPSLHRNIAFSGGLLRDGASLMTGSMLPLLVPRSIDLFVSVMMGPAALGLLRIAFRIFEFVGQLVIMPLVGVATAQLARFSADPAGLRQSYLRFTQVSASMLCPLMIGFAIVAPELVPIMFGEKWVSCVPLVQMVSILALTAPPNYFFPAAMTTLGQSRSVLRQGVFQVVVGIVLAAIAAQYSLLAVLASQILRGILLTGYNFLDMRKHAGLTVREIARSMAPPYVATLVMACMMIGTRLAVADRLSTLSLLLALTAVGVFSYSATILAGVKLRLWPDFLSVIARLVPERLRRFIPA